MKFTRLSIFVFIFLIIYTILFITGNIDFELPWRTKNQEESTREFDAYDDETPPNPNMEDRKVAKLEREVHQYTEKLEAMMKILQNLAPSNSALHLRSDVAKEETLKKFDGQSIKITSNPNFCSHPDIEVVIMVLSRPTSFSRRSGIRTSYGDLRLFPTIRVFFVIGPNEKTDMTAEIGRENLVYGDIVLTDRPMDAYRNTSFKVLAGLYYIDKYCKSASFVVKTDEDMLINSFNLLDYLKTRKRIVNNGYFNSPDDYQANGSFFCNRNEGPPIREVGNPWYVPPEDYPGEMYPASCSGMGVMFDRNIVPTLYAGSYYVKHLNIEDVFFPGLVRKEYSIPIEFVDELFGGAFVETGIFFHGMENNLMIQEKWNWIMVYEALKTFKEGNRSIPLKIDHLSPLNS